MRAIGTISDLSSQAKPVSICPKVTAEQFNELTYRFLAADPLSPKTVSHRGSPGRKDIYGHDKKWLYERLADNNDDFFQDLANAWNKGWWYPLTISQRTYLKQGEKLRPIDISSQIKRILSAWVFLHLEKLVNKTRALDSSVIAYRNAKEFPAYRNRRDGFTVQDIYASECHRLIRDYGPFVVLVDLKDAFGNLPHLAIQMVLKELGINHQDRRTILELLRIRTMKTDGCLLKPRGYGIEQGNYLAPITFNLVASMIARSLRAVGSESASYGDDVVLVANSQKGAEQAFETYESITSSLGFKNVRPLGTAGKATRIIDTRVERVPLIKTYLLGRGEIALAPDEMIELRSRLPKNPSLSALRRANRWKAVSKSFFRTLLPAFGPGGEDRTRGWLRPRAETTKGPAAPGSLEPPSLQGETDGACSPPVRMAMGQDDQGVPNEDTHLIGTGKEGMASMGDISISSSMLPAIPSYCNRRPQHHSVGVSPVSLVSTASPVVTAGTDQNRANGRVSVLRGGPGGRVTSGVNGGEDVGYHSSPSDSVLLEIRSMDLEALGEGRRLRAGNYYKGHAGTILDVRGLAAAVPGWRLSHSLHQTVRVGSVRGITGLLGHPGCMAFQTLGEVAGVRVVDQEETPEGMVVTISRRPAPVFRPIRSRVGKLPKDVHVVVVGARCSGTDVRKWTVTAITDGAVKKLRMTTSTPNRMISRVEAIAGALRDYPGRRVAIPSRLVPVRLLSLDVRIRQVGLADAVEVLRGWNWKTRRQWLAGIRTENSG